jgi:phosphohistidine phosphatase
MKTVYIVRHAKSSWQYDDIDDIDRPLKRRGINDARLVSKILNLEIIRPDIFVSSSANRALHTAMIFADNFNYPLANLKIKKSLYSFSDGYLIKTIMALDDAFDTAIIFSHDHGINTFVNKFGSEVIPHVPTCGVIGIQFDIKHWKSINKNKTIKKGETVLFKTPKMYKTK